MKSSTPPNYERLFESVVTALQDGSVAVARRHVMKARASVGEDKQLRGSIAALEFVCDARVDDDDKRRNQSLRDLQSRTSTESRPYANAVGCAISDCGERLGDPGLLELAEAWFAQLVSTAPDAILLANHGLVLERLDRLDDAIVALSKAVEADPDFHSARLRLARLASRAGELQCAADAYRGYLKAHPDDAHEWISLAIVLCDMRQIQDAEQAYWRAAGLEPSNVSLHFNWLISAQRAGDLERARDALKKLKAIAPQEWRTRVAEAYILEKSGDAVGAFRLGRQVFLDLIAERTDEAENKSIDYVARRISEIALRSHEQFRAEAEEFVGNLFAEEIFTDENLALIRALEQPATADLFVHALQVEALYRGQDEPFACFVNYRALARDKDEASALTQQFEERCGANEVRVRQEDVEQLEACEGPAHAGVCWRSGRMSFPADEFGTDE